MKPFKIILDSSFFASKDILDFNDPTYKVEVLEKPYRKWYKYLFQIITFRIYKAPYQYKCKLK